MFAPTHIIHVNACNKTNNHSDQTNNAVMTPTCFFGFVYVSLSFMPKHLSFMANAKDKCEKRKQENLLEVLRYIVKGNQIN